MTDLTPDALAELRRKAERAIVYPLNRDECLALIAHIDERIDATTADDWLSHRFHEVCDERDAAVVALDAERARNRQLSESFQAAVEGDNSLIAGQNARIARLEAVAEAARRVKAEYDSEGLIELAPLFAALAVLEEPQ